MSDDTLHPDAVPQSPADAITEPIAPSEMPDSAVTAVPEAHEPFELQPQPIPSAPPEPKRPSAAKEEASQSPFSVTVGQVYDGPLDLLLDLIRKQNIDIYDIPIARITSQFLDYTHHLKQTDVDSAGEFIYMASLLIHIKSKMLLPRDPSDVLGGDAEDPRRELVERLLEHERFKAAAQMLMQKQQIVAVCIAHQMIHRRRGLPEADAHVAIAEHICGLPWRALRARQLVQVERMRPQRTFERGPARRRMLVMEERRGPEEAFLADLALVRAGRHVGVCLARSRALDLRNEDRALHVTALLTTRLCASGPARSTRTTP